MFGPWLSMSDNAMPGGWKTEASRIPGSVIPAKAGIHIPTYAGSYGTRVHSAHRTHQPHFWFPCSCVGTCGLLWNGCCWRNRSAFPRGSVGTRNAQQGGNPSLLDVELRHSREGGNPHSHVCGKLRHPGPLCSPYSSTTFLVPMLLRGNQKTTARHSPLSAWIPAFAGMTELVSVRGYTTFLVPTPLRGNA